MPTPFVCCLTHTPPCSSYTTGILGFFPSFPGALVIFMFTLLDLGWLVGGDKPGSTMAWHRRGKPGWLVVKTFLCSPGGVHYIPCST